jgi:hypothetical protein
MLETRSANLMELAAALPRETGAADHSYQYIERQLKNQEIGADAVIKSYAMQVIGRSGVARGQTIILQMDQSHVNETTEETTEVLMVSARLRERAVPVAWRVRSTQGNIGFGVQQELLDSVFAWLISLFKSGLRFLRRCIALAQPIPPLWEVWTGENSYPQEIEGW